MSTITIPLAVYPTGSIPFGPMAVPGGLSGFSVTVARCTTLTPSIWTSPAAIVGLSVDCSYDGGVTWELNQIGWSQGGGIIKDKQGNEIANSVISGNVALNGQPATHIRGAFTVTNGPVLTSVVIAAQ